MKTIFVQSVRGRYPIHIGRGLVSKTGDLMRKSGLEGRVLIVTQKSVARFYLAPLTRSLRSHKFQPEVYFLPDGEKAKSERELFRIFHLLLKKKFERRDILLALGGGVTGDFTGFVASVYLRGVPFVNVPTTLLAQVDSSIGGKTGINLNEGKNLVGAFYPPRLVVSDIRTLATLSARELKASLAEVVKYGMIRRLRLFETVEKSGNHILLKDLRLFENIVTASASIKALVTSRDEFETKGERMILNYGHTFGHAFEQVLNYRKLVHGEAVAIGMVCAARLAVSLKLLPDSVERRQRKVLKNLGLPVSLSRYRMKSREILTAMQRDKKKKGGKLRFVLPVRIGKVVVKAGIAPSLIQKILREAGAR